MLTQITRVDLVTTPTWFLREARRMPDFVTSLNALPTGGNGPGWSILQTQPSGQSAGRFKRTALPLIECALAVTEGTRDWRGCRSARKPGCYVIMPASATVLL